MELSIMCFTNRINLQLEPEQFRFVAEQSIESKTNKTQVLRNIIQKYMDNLEPQIAKVDEQAIDEYGF